MTTIHDDTKTGTTTLNLGEVSLRGRKRPGNDNSSGGGEEDTTALVAHRGFVAAVTAALVRFGRRRHLKDDIPEVQTRALEVARVGPMPRNLEKWQRLGRRIARGYAVDEHRKNQVRGLHDTGLCEDPDEHGPLERANPRDPVDTKRYLALLKEMFDRGEMPEMGGEILWGEAEGLTQREIADETGLSLDQVEYRLKRMRSLWNARLAKLGMLVLLLTAGVLVSVPIGGVASNDVPDAPPAHTVVVQMPTREERASALRAEGMAECAAARWQECLARFDEARSVDPEGVEGADVEEARRRAEVGIEWQMQQMTAKPRP